MQMDKRNCDGKPDETKLSSRGIRFEPEAAREVAADLSTLSFSAAALRQEQIAAATEKQK